MLVAFQVNAQVLRRETGRASATVQKPKITISYALPVDCTEGSLKSEECHIKPKTDKDDTETPKRDLYYTLGGVRLKIDFNPESLTEEQRLALPMYKWTMGYGGYICDDFDVTNIEHQFCEAVSATEKIEGKTTLYWEPVDWVSNMNAEIELKISFVDPFVPEKVIRFKIGTRVLQPTTPLMIGPDVKMLEQVLWQLGLSPQKYNPGSEGNRIGSRRFNGKLTAACSTKKKASMRHVFYSGWSSCDKNLVSIEGMVKRFQGRHLYNGQKGRASIHAGRSTITDGIVGNNTLAFLKGRVTEYLRAYTSYKDYGSMHIENASLKSVIDTWIANAVEVWEDGYGNYADATYTEDIHESVLTLAGKSKSWKTREDLLRSWKLKESPHHWGSNRSFPRTAFRMTEGGADEYGSLSFSQLLFYYRYSQVPCTIHRVANLNLYDPEDQIMTFVLHTVSGKVNSAGDSTCKEGFYKAFNTTQWKKNHKTGDKLKAYQHGNSNIKTIKSEAKRS